eukprot:6358814-Alexandrium_andersonii.AAC.1
MRVRAWGRNEVAFLALDPAAARTWIQRHALAPVAKALVAMASALVFQDPAQQGVQSSGGQRAAVELRVAGRKEGHALREPGQGGL